MDINALVEKVKQFNNERDWDQFHNPKDLVLALMSEVGELAECYRWLNEAELAHIIADSEKKKKIADELADIIMYISTISYKMNIDLTQAIEEKFEKNKLRFSLEKSKGVHTNFLEGYKPSAV